MRYNSRQEFFNLGGREKENKGHTMSTTGLSYTTAHATGPRTHAGKAVAARNATTHGLFARDIVLPALGEDPEGYRQLEAELAAQLQPGNLLERHYVEKIAAASWRLRRLHRWQAQLFEDAALTEDERLDKLDKVLRHETHLHRQIDTAVKMLNKDVPQLHEGRARRRALSNTQRFEGECRKNLEADLEVTVEARRLLQPLTAAPALDHALLDAAPTAQDEVDAEEAGEAENCENEPICGPKWRAEQAVKERARLLATLEHDISEVHEDGRPVYVSERAWKEMLYQIEIGKPETAAHYAEWNRKEFLYDQGKARALVAAEAGAPPPSPSDAASGR